MCHAYYLTPLDLPCRLVRRVHHSPKRETLMQIQAVAAATILGFSCSCALGQGSTGFARSITPSYPSDPFPTWTHTKCISQSCLNTVIFDVGANPAGCNASCLGSCEFCNGNNSSALCVDWDQQECVPTTVFFICGTISTSSCYWATTSECWCNTSSGVPTQDKCEIARCDP